jgi:hypothetical protein
LLGNDQKNEKARKERLTHNKNESKALIYTTSQYNYSPNIEISLHAMTT